jgi:DNA-binding CsgD family transcriptional regulator
VLRTASAEATGHVPLSTAISTLARRARIDLSPAPDPEPPARESRPFGLTDREYQVVKLVGQGLTNAEIGRTLFISAKTVSVHVSSIMRKLGVSTRVQASTIAARNRNPGLTQPAGATAGCIVSSTRSAAIRTTQAAQPAISPAPNLALNS